MAFVALAHRRCRDAIGNAMDDVFVTYYACTYDQNRVAIDSKADTIPISTVPSNIYPSLIDATDRKRGLAMHSTGGKCVSSKTCVPPRKPSTVCNNASFDGSSPSAIQRALVWCRGSTRAMDPTARISLKKHSLHNLARSLSSCPWTFVKLLFDVVGKEMLTQT